MSCDSSEGSRSRRFRELNRLFPTISLLLTDIDPDPSFFLDPPPPSLILQAALESRANRRQRTDNLTHGHQPGSHNLASSHARPSVSGQPESTTGRQTRPKPTCLICLETPDRTDTWVKPSARCTHGLVACKTCFREYIVHKLTIEGLVTLICPDLGCRRVLEYQDVVKRIGDSTACLERYNALIAQIDLEKHPNYVWCMNPPCGRGQIHKEGAAVPTVTCDHCHARSCFRHRVPWHSGLTCEQYTGLAKYKQENHASEEYIARHAKRCPNPSCGRPILKIEGCDHMTCCRPGGCGHEFCWACLADYDPIRRLGNHHHGSACPHYSGPRRRDQAPTLEDNGAPRNRRNLRGLLNLRGLVTRPVIPIPARPAPPIPRALNNIPRALNNIPRTPSNIPRPPNNIPQPPNNIPQPPNNIPQTPNNISQPPNNVPSLVPNVPPAPTPLSLQPQPPTRPNASPSPPHHHAPLLVPAPSVNPPVISDPVPASRPAPAPPSVATRPPRRQMRRALVPIRKEVSPNGKAQEVLSIISSATWWPMVYVLLVLMGLILHTGDTNVGAK